MNSVIFSLNVLHSIFRTKLNLVISGPFVCWKRTLIYYMKWLTRVKSFCIGHQLKLIIKPLGNFVLFFFFRF